MMALLANVTADPTAAVLLQRGPLPLFVVAWMLLTVMLITMPGGDGTEP